MSLIPPPRRARAQALVQKASLLLSVDRHGEALAAARAARRARGDVDLVRLALLETDALLGLERHPEVVELTTRLLARPIADADDRARLRAARAAALWLQGRSAPARREAREAGREALTPMTRGRSHEVLAMIARHEHRLDDALGCLETAMTLYEQAGYTLGTSRVLGQGTRVLRDAGRFDEAARLHEHWAEAASMVTRRGEIAAAHTERANRLMQLGHWADATEAAAQAQDEFRRLHDSREHTSAGIVAARTALAAGDFARARTLLDRARAAWHPGAGDARTRGEAELLACDLELALGDMTAAARAAREALALFDGVGDPEGICRSRVRHAGALLAAGKPAPALREARRAARVAPESRRDLVVLAHLAVGRVLVRAGRADAVRAFTTALASALPEHGLMFAARLGLAVARGADRGAPEIADALAGLERWGDRRLLALCLDDLRAMTTGADATPPTAVPVPAATVRLGEVPAALVAAACAVRDGVVLPWVGAVRAVQSVVPWVRASVVGAGGWELAVGREAPIPLSEDDPLRAVTARIDRPAVLRHADVPELAVHPIRRLFALEAALVAPLSPAGALVLELAGPPSSDALAIAAAVARLVPPVEPPEAEDAPSFPGIVGSSEPMQALLRQVARAAAHPHAAVHVFGETGSGKEKIAEAIHQKSARSRGPFVPVNVSCIQDELFETEMFGCAKGAFTGAVTDRPGYVEKADGGTLFLDEIADLSLAAQAKLLRFLQSHEYRRVGETQVRRAEVRIVTAANVRLADRVREGRFREDVWYRLETLTLDVPPLRDRGADVVRLARHFLRLEAAKYGRPAPELTAEAARLLQAWSWPGNVRELENQCARALLEAGRAAIRAEHLGPHLRAPRAANVRSLREASRDWERVHIQDALARNGGNRARTASVLGLSRQALVTKIGRLGLSGC